MTGIADAERQRPHTPKSLAKVWECSERHVRNLIAANELRSFRLGEKLLRIPVDAVEEFERRNMIGPTSVEPPK